MTPPPNPGATPPRQPQPVTKQAGFEDAKWLFVGGSLVGTLIIATISVYQWLSPAMPIALALGMGAALCAVIAVLICERDRASAFVKGALIWALCALPTALWALSPVRAGVVERLGDTLTPMAQTAALSDADAQVRLRACVALGTQNQGTAAREIMAAFSASPQMSARCIQQVAQGDPQGASRLATAFMSQWDSALRSQESEAVCAATPHLFGVGALTVAQPTLDLTECAATYPGDEAARCCADALTAEYAQAASYTDALGSPDALPMPRRAQLFTALVPYAFAQIGAERRPLPQFEANLLNTPPGKTWVLALGCDGLLGGGGAEYVEGFEAIADTQSCQMPGSQMPAVNTWKNICAVWSEQPKRSANLCASIDSDAKEQAIVAASSRVHDAIRALYASEAGREIVAFGAYMEGYALSDTGRGDRFADAMGQFGTHSKMNPRLRRMAQQIHNNKGAALRDLQNAAAEISKKPVNRSESVQDLLDREAFNPPATWQEVKELMPREQRDKYQQQIDEHKDSLGTP